VNAYDVGCEVDTALTKIACARFWPEYVQLSRRTMPHPDGALIDAAAARRAETAASSTSPEVTFAGLPTVIADDVEDVTAVEADRNVGDEPVPDSGPRLPNDVDAVTASPATAQSRTPKVTVSRRGRRSRSRLRAVDLDRMVIVPPLGPSKGQLAPRENVGWAQRSDPR
jgi:hypothetical protein